ncbi:MAG TPA: ABC transporter permease [Candidatus Acidoferrales bacterium]|nr:ABC transporter permease [Candidatus Acidoferrales bacterium]
MRIIDILQHRVRSFFFPTNVELRKDTVRKDLRFALRQLHKYPGFTCTAIFVLALGMCAGLAIFAFVDAALIKPLPYRKPDQLVAVYETNAMFARSNLSYPDYLDWKQRNRVFSSLDVFQQTGFLLATPAGAQPARGARVSAGFFQTLGVEPILGRTFYPAEDLPSAARVALLSYDEWQRQYGGRRDVLGQVVVLNGSPHVIIGVLPRGFHFAPVGRAAFWTAMQATYPCDLRRSCHSIYGVARLREELSLQAALSNVKAIAGDLEKQYPDSNRNQGAALVPLAEAMTGDIHPMLMVLLAGAGLLLLIAGVNVAGLLLLRSENRKREIAVRTALGASSSRLVAQFATEAIVLAAGGGVAGLALAAGAIQLLQRLISDDFRARLPFLDGLGLNGHVATAGIALAALAALLLSAAPCLRIGSLDLRSGLAEATRGSAGTVWRRLGSKLVVLELAMAVVLLAGAGLLGKSLFRLMRVDLGIRPDRLVTMEVVAPRSTYGTDRKAIALARRVVSDVEDLPGVTSVGIAVNGVPITSNGNTTWFHVPDRPWHGEHYDAPERDVSPGYFTTLGARLLRGRYFNGADDASRPTVAIVNRALARTYFPNEDAVGRQIIEHSTPPLPVQIVGIVDDVREGPLDAPVPPVLYFPFDQRPDSYFALVVRSSGGEPGLLPAMAAVIRKIDAGIVPRGGMTMIDRVQDSESAYLHRSMAWLVGGFALLALLLGVVGLYGVVAYSVRQRNREIGIRMALGAQPRSICAMILREAGWLVGSGAVIGSASSVAAAGLMHGLLFGVSSWDATTLIAVTGLLGMAALLASFIPARRAASVNPVESLRAE